MRKLAISLLVVGAAAGVLPGTGGGDAGAAPGDLPAVAFSPMPDGDGYRVGDSGGGVFTFGDAPFFGSIPGLRVAGQRIPPVRMVDLVATPDGDGYWALDEAGGVFTFGDAPFFGSIPGLRRAGQAIGQADAVALAPTPDGDGYVILDEAGGLFTFGDAPFFGSIPGLRAQGQAIRRVQAVDLAITPSGGGQWVLDEAGGVFTFGDAPFFGSIPGLRRAGQAIGQADAVAFSAMPDEGGYRVGDSEGGVFTFGDAPFSGSIPGLRAAGQSIPPVKVVDLVATADGGGYWGLDESGGVFTFGNAGFFGSIPGLRPVRPSLRVTTAVGGLTIPWDAAFTPDGTLLYTERPGRLSAFSGGSKRLLAAPGDVFASGETGMMGLAVDPDFASNRVVHVCQGFSSGGTNDIRVHRWRVNEGFTSASRVGGPTVSGIQITSGRHGGCRLRFGPEGFLWVGTGDSAVSSNPQDLGSLNGKVLRVDPDTGDPAPGNPFGSRVFTFGHRNIQGLAVQPSSGDLYSGEHGPARDDEVNRLVRGGNYGWDPGPGYDESVPMTDTAEFPEAVEAVWSSGAPTIALSGIAFLDGPEWGAWDGALVGAALKGSQLRILTLSDDGRRVVRQDVRVTDRGRLRSVTLGPDGDLYVTTSNGGGADAILKVEPVG